MKRKCDSIIEEINNERNLLENMSFEELDEYILNGKSLLNENTCEPTQIDIPFEDYLKQNNLVDVTSFFVSHGLKI